MLSQFSFMTVSLQTIHIWIMLDRKSWLLATLVVAVDDDSADIVVVVS